MNKKRTLWAVRIILIALIVCWMMTIFDFSAANGQQSQSYSDGITIKIIRLIKKTAICYLRTGSRSILIRLVFL